MDIILDQVSKVNQFQTRSLVLAIDSIESKLDEIRQVVASEESIVGGRSQYPSTIKGDFTRESTVTPPTSNPSPTPTLRGLGEGLVKNFQRALTEQVSSILTNVKEEIDEVKRGADKENYRTKKGLEFDLRSIVRSLEDLQQIKPAPPPRPPDDPIIPSRQDRSQQKGIETEQQEKGKTLPPDIIEAEMVGDSHDDDEGYEGEYQREQKHAPKVEPKKKRSHPFSDLEHQLGSMKSVNDVEKMIENVGKTLERFGIESSTSVTASEEKYNKKPRQRYRPTKQVDDDTTQMN